MWAERDGDRPRAARSSLARADTEWQEERLIPIRGIWAGFLEEMGLR